MRHVGDVKAQIGAPEGDALGQPLDSDVGHPLTEEVALSPDVKLPPPLVSEGALPTEQEAWQALAGDNGEAEEKMPKV